MRDDEYRVVIIRESEPVVLHASPQPDGTWHVRLANATAILLDTTGPISWFPLLHALLDLPDPPHLQIA